MIVFLAGVATGCLVGVTLTIVLLLFFATWFTEPQKQVVECSLRSIVATSMAILGVGCISYALHLPKAAAMILFLSAVFLIADQFELLAALIASGLSSITLIFLFLPPLHSFRVATTGDRLSLAVFLLASVVGCRLICARRLEESAAIRIESSGLE
jgi:K+-sensing histidine kinase KdpD